MLKCPIHELPGNVIIDNFYARLSLQDKTLLDTSCAGSVTRNKEDFKWDLLDRIQDNTEGWENDKGRESGINISTAYGLESKVVANFYKAFASYFGMPKESFESF